MHSIGPSPGARRLFATSILARLPLAMLSIGLLVHAQRLTGSFAAAGVVTGVYAIALGVGGPLLGRSSTAGDRPRCCWSAPASAAALLVAIALQPGAPRSPSWSRSPPASGWRTAGRRLPANPTPGLVSDPGAVRAAYALEASVVELTYIFGPPLALCTRRAVVHRRGPRAGAARPAGGDRRVRRATGLTPLAAGPDAGPRGGSSAHPGDADAGDRPGRRRHAAWR